MKFNHSLIASLILAATLGGTALAQGGPGPMGHGQMGQGMGMPGATPGGPMAGSPQRAEKGVGALKTALKLTPEQLPLWEAFVEKKKAESAKNQKMMPPPATDEKLSAPERMAKMEAHMEERLASMKAVNASFNRLYAALKPEQRAVADDFASRMGNGAKGGMPRGPGPGMTPPAGGQKPPG